jgi:hypothetical protein
MFEEDDTVLQPGSRVSGGPHLLVVQRAVEW